MPPHRARSGTLALVLLAAACGGSSHGGAPDEPSILVTEEMGHPHVGDPAPELELPDQEGHPISLASMRGRIVVVAFATSWCPFSQAQQPHLRRLAQDYDPERVRVVVVNVDETEAGFRRYVERVPMPMAVLRDPSATRSRAFIPPRPPARFRPGSEWKAIVSANLVLDAAGRIQLFTLVDTLHFDAELVHVRRTVDRLLTALEP